MRLNLIVAKVVDAVAVPSSRRLPQHSLTDRERRALRRAADRPVTLPARLR